ncbi:MAG: NAD(+) diphosphatase [Dongiaceae bacterium]
MPADPLRPNFYAGAALDRLAQLRRDAAWIAERLADPTTRILPVWRAHNLVIPGSSPGTGSAPGAAWLSVVRAQHLLREVREIAFLGFYERVAHFAIEISDLDDPAPVAGLAEAATFADLRAVGPLMDRDQGALLAYARGMMHWHARHRFCGVCGHPTESAEAGHVRRCTSAACGASHFPRTDPAVIMLVHDGGDRVVLGRQKVWPAGMHSVLAGFVEPGESLEDAVRREVAEEVGIAVTDVRYHSSQPWPFPASIMLGFTARAEATDLALAMDELETARWYTRAELLASPETEAFRLPRRDSIARRLLEDWLAEG